MFIVHRIILLLNWLAVGALLLAYASSFIRPDTWIVPSFFGLIFPFLLLSNVLCLVYWLLFRRFRMLYSGIVLLIGFPYWNRSFNFWSTSNVPADKQVTKVLSYNVRLFDLYNWTSNNSTKNKIFEYLKKQDADVVCFQEFFHQDPPSPFVTRDTLVQFLKAKNISEAYTHKLIQRQYFGLAIFTVYPILNSGKIVFENDSNNNALWVDVKRQKDTIRIYNVHLSSIRFQKSDYEALGEDAGPGRRNNTAEQQIFSRLSIAFKKRIAQTQKVLKHVKTSPYKVVLCGDFNDTPMSYCYSQFNEVLNDAFTQSGGGWGATYTGNLPFLRIDYIWHSSNLESSGFTVGDQILSDHYPVTCFIY